MHRYVIEWQHINRAYTVESITYIINAEDIIRAIQMVKDMNQPWTNDKEYNSTFYGVCLDTMEYRDILSIDSTHIIEY